MFPVSVQLPVNRTNKSDKNYQDSFQAIYLGIVVSLSATSET